MNKTELIEAIAKTADFTKADAGRSLEAFIETIMGTLKVGGQVTIPGFGTFQVGHRSARTGRNPQTGESIEIKAARIPKFKAGKKLKEAVQD